MSKLTDRTSYLKGLADGMNLSREKDANKLILEVLDVLRDMATEVEALRDDVDDLDEYVANMDEDLLELTNSATEAHGCSHHHHHPHVDEDQDEEEEEPAIYYTCPFCHQELKLDLDDVTFSEDMPCPECGEPLFPEGLDTAEDSDPDLAHMDGRFPQEDDDLYEDDDEEEELENEDKPHMD